MTSLIVIFLCRRVLNPNEKLQRADTHASSQFKGQKQPPLSRVCSLEYLWLLDSRISNSEKGNYSSKYACRYCRRRRKIKKFFTVTPSDMLLLPSPHPPTKSYSHTPAYNLHVRPFLNAHQKAAKWQLIISKNSSTKCLQTDDPKARKRINACALRPFFQPSAVLLFCLKHFAHSSLP